MTVVARAPQLVLISVLCAPHVSARLFSVRGGTGGSTITLQKRVHVNTLITEPGTVEVEWGNLYSFTSGSYTMPSTIKFTPEGKSIIWGRTEYSAAFDSVNSAVNGGDRSTQFSDRVTLTATSVVKDGEKLDIAIAPAATFFLRDESGVRLGATAIARYDTGRNSIGGSASWSAATASSPTNPAGTWDIGMGYGRRLAASGALGHFTPHFNAVYEKSTRIERIISAFGGVEYQVTEKVAIDVSGQRFGLAGAGIDRQLLIGLTVNLGKVQ